MSQLTKRDGFKLVPWFSLTEWHQVYKQIYSNDHKEQTRGYETLLVWKARMPKLPVGVECTLALIQVCIRDREWTDKIDSGDLPMYYENDLVLMYSTVIMRFLNHVSNVGITKERSMYGVAKDLKIPVWIVNLRHTAAHGHELPSLDLLRLAVNILLAWVHDEYWTAEAQALQNFSLEDNDSKNSELKQTLVELIDLWMAVGLYIEAGFTFISDLTDEHLQEVLREMLPNDKKTRTTTQSADNSGNIRLKIVRTYLITDISVFLLQNKNFTEKTKVILNVLFDNTLFLPTSDFFELYRNNSRVDQASIHLPLSMINFWQSFINMMHANNMLEALTRKLIQFVNSTNEDEDRRLCAALWINAIAHGLLKLRNTQDSEQLIEQSSNNKYSPRIMRNKIRDNIHNSTREMQNSLNFNILKTIPPIFQDADFISDIAMKTNEFTMKFIRPILELASITKQQKNGLLELIQIYTENNLAVLANCENTGEYTDEDIMKICEIEIPNETNEIVELLADKTVRNTSWKLAEPDEWESCVFGILPWQRDSLEVLQTREISPKLICLPSTSSDIVPGILARESLTSCSKVNWDQVLMKKRVKRKHCKGDVDVIMNKAMQVAKTKRGSKSQVNSVN